MDTYSSFLPLFAALFPICGGAALGICCRRGRHAGGRAANFISFIALLFSIWQLLAVQSGRVLTFTLPWYLGFGLRWRADYLSAVFAVVVSAVWFLAGLFSIEYMAGDDQQARFFAASTFTLGSTLGVFLAGDLSSLFLFFELMTFAAYLLVVHSEDEEALKASNLYLFMSIVGGLFLLGAIFFIHHTVGGTEFNPVLEQLILAGLNPWLLFGAVVLGFGVKAGMLPLHAWLPRAHPAAPAPASALLSALMIKTGAYGFLRFFYVLFSLRENSPHFYLQESFGYLFIWFGAATMLGGALMALISKAMKRVLAYSSISQMGYILFSLGAGVMLGADGAFGLAGAWLHMINHAFFKSFLFLLAGAVYLRTGELDLDKLGGLRRPMPLTLAFFLAAAASITGVPGFNGYASKVLIHAGILEAYALKGWPSLLWLERVFVFTGGLTAAYISKIWLRAFFGRPGRDWAGVKDLSPAQVRIFTIYTVITAGIGIGAQRAVDYLVLPVVRMFDFGADGLARLEEIPFWEGGELQGPLQSYFIAGCALAALAIFRFVLPRRRCLRRQ